MLIDADKFHFDSRDSDPLYVAEISELELGPRGVPRNFTLFNCPKPGMSRSFSWVDTDYSGGDIAGWRYEEVAGPNRGLSWEDGHPPKKVPILKVLIIND